MVFGGIGEYPVEYDPKVHGPYDPARYYGKPDTPLSQVKLGQLAGWLGRRNKSPRAMRECFSRACWRWQHKYVHPKRAGSAAFFQLVSGLMVFFYVINYNRISHEKNYKYH